MQGGAPPALHVRGVEKSYPGTRALDGVTVSVAPGEIHALLGGNGSGKSTLIKILAGVEPADAGSVGTSGSHHELEGWTPHDAWSAGLRFVHQQPSSVPDLTVAENLAIGHGFETGRLGRISWRRQRERASEVLERFDIDVPPSTPVGELGPAQQTMVTIARALQDQDESHGGVLFLDEPTAALPEREADLLLEALRRYAGLGQTIVYVSHRLEETLRLADRATVLRDGQVAGECAGADLNHDILVELIVGHPVSRPVRGEVQASTSETLLKLEGLCAGRAEKINLTASGGEVVGVAGLLGSGRSSLLRSIFGAQDRSGTVEVGGKLLKPNDVRLAMASGVALVPENRREEAAFPEMAVGDNLSAASVPDYWSRLRLHQKRERSDSRQLIQSYGIKAPSADAPLATLSGGNQQKVMVARWLRRQPKVLLLDEPTQGVDIGARADIHSLILGAVRSGAVALVASSDPEELVELSDRVIVLVDGRITHEISGDDLTDDRISALVHEETR